MRERVRRRGQAGVLAGSDGLLFGMLVMVAGSLLVLHLWATVDARAALDAAAREYLRTYTEQVDAAEAATAAERAARDALRARGATWTDASIEAPAPAAFGPCAPATVTMAVELPAVTLPFLDGLGARTVTVEHTELIDAHRELAAGSGYDLTRTACGEG